MNRLLTTFLPVWLGVLGVQGQVDLPEMGRATSVSRQFFAYGPKEVKPLPVAAGQTAVTNLLKVNPPLAVIFAERIKAELLRLLDAPDQWQGKFYLTMHPAYRPDEEIETFAIFTPRGWNYHVDLPNQLESARLVQALVPLLLAEIANRTPGQHAAEVPRWLGAGLAARVLASERLLLTSPESPLLPGDTLPVTRTVRDVRRLDPLASARAVLRASPPLRLDELGWPSPNELAGPRGELFNRSAEFLVYELLLLPNGPAHLRRMLTLLPVEPDWKGAFLKGFSEHFQKTSDAEKWWSLTVAHLVGHDASRTWSPRDSMIQLESVLQVPVEVRMSTNDLPLRSETSLQFVIRQWPPADQVNALRRKSSQLALLRPRVSSQLTTLLDDYRRTLDAYLQALIPVASARTVPARMASKLKAAAEETVRRLDLMDILRQDMKRYGRDVSGPSDDS